MSVRFKTSYPGVYYRETRKKGRKEKEKVFYVVYRKGDKVIEQKIGHQDTDAMTAEKAAGIRADYMKDFRTTGNNAFNTNKETKRESISEITEQVAIHRSLLEEKWLLFMESSTDAFSLLDENLRMVELNEAALRLFPKGTRKEDLLGKNLEEFAPGAKARGDIERFQSVLRTGVPFFMDRIVPPPKFGKKFLNYKVFKVGDVLGLIITDITELIRKEQELRKRESDLEETNTALKVLLKKREEDKLELEEKMFYNIKQLIMPYLEKLQDIQVDSTHKAYLDIVQSNLEEIVSPLARTLSTRYLRFTPMEVKISNLVKLGKTTKEMASMLYVAPRTVDTYRDNIRKKLGIKNKKINLRTYLSTLK